MKQIYKVGDIVTFIGNVTPGIISGKIATTEKLEITLRNRPPAYTDSWMMAITNVHCIVTQLETNYASCVRFKILPDTADLKLRNAILDKTLEKNEFGYLLNAFWLKVVPSSEYELLSL